MIALLAILLTPLFLNAQNPPAAEQQKIEALIKHVGDLKDAKFVRNGSTYEPATAVRFLRGKWNDNKAGVKNRATLSKKSRPSQRPRANHIFCVSATAKKSAAVNFSSPNLRK